MEKLCLNDQTIACTDGFNYTFYRKNYKKADLYSGVLCDKKMDDGCYNLAKTQCALGKENEASEALGKYFLYKKDRISKVEYEYIKNDGYLSCLKNNGFYLKKLDEYKKSFGNN